MAAGALFQVIHQVRIKRFASVQRRLAQKLGIEASTPILLSGNGLHRALTSRAGKPGTRARFALTSGSTSEPKRTPYSPQRLRRVKLTFNEIYLRACLQLGVKRKSIYIFHSFDHDQSLTTLLLEDKSPPPFPVFLQAPYRVQQHPSIRRLADRYGVPAVRLWILAIANPGVLYATNPSSISTFLDEVHAHWRCSTRLIREYVNCPADFGEDVSRVHRQIESRGSRDRLKKLARSVQPLPVSEWAPGVEAYICWTGGYVSSFLRRLQLYLPPDRYRLIPMYSMSTETLGTVTHFLSDSVTFLPLAPGVLYEFIPQHEEDIPDNIVPATGLLPGRVDSLVVSDEYGLKRYQTGDLFECTGFVGRVPRLPFRRRRDLGYSFTGEKLTAEQVQQAFGRLRKELSELAADTFLTCLPSHPSGEELPHYKIVVVRQTPAEPALPKSMAARWDEWVTRLNLEYERKRNTGRLGGPRLVLMSPADLTRCLQADPNGKSGEAQFKFLPLYPRLWKNWNLRRLLESPRRPHSLSRRAFRPR